MATKKFSIAVSQDTLDELKKIGLVEDRKQNYLINQAIEMFIVDWKLDHKVKE